MTEEINEMINKFCDSVEKRINQYNSETELQRLKQENEQLISALEEIKKTIKSYDLTVDNGASVDTIYTIRKIINECIGE